MDPKDNDRLRILKEEREQHISSIEKIDAEILRIGEGNPAEVVEEPSAPTILPSSVEGSPVDQEHSMKEVAEQRGDISDTDLGVFLKAAEKCVRNFILDDLAKFELFLEFTFTPTAKPTFKITDEGDLTDEGVRKLYFSTLNYRLPRETPDTRSSGGPVTFTLRLIFPKPKPPTLKKEQRIKTDESKKKKSSNSLGRLLSLTEKKEQRVNDVIDIEIEIAKALKETKKPVKSKKRGFTPEGRARIAAKLKAQGYK